MTKTTKLDNCIKIQAQKTILASWKQYLDQLEYTRMPIHISFLESLLSHKNPIQTIKLKIDVHSLS